MIEPIANFTTTGTTPGITFSSIPGTYKHLLIIGNAKAASGNTDIGVQMNGDTGSTNYNAHMLYGNSNGTHGAYRYTGSRAAITNWSYTDTTVFNLMHATIHNYANTNLWKAINFKSSRGNTGGGNDIGQSYWRNTNAITSLYIFGTTQNLSAGCTFSLYGII
jgi:hypothetical protein